jgi:A/G-specific adenine glycosylase
MLKPRCRKRATRDPTGFRAALHDWFLAHGRTLPWRQTTDPYAILVSEIMLQQTQVATVLAHGHYQRFLDAFPTARTLAEASDEALLKAWEGLGYYRRARLLRDAARTITTLHHDRFPESAADLLALPGVGRYTAGALRAFAFNQPAVLVDGNIARVIARLTDFQQPIDTTQGNAAIWQSAATLACDRHPRIHHSAIMELGQTICRTNHPDCQACPAANWCATKTPQTIPIKQKKATLTKIREHAIWWVAPDGRILLHHERGKRRTGLWRLPVRQPQQVEGLPVIDREEYPITRYKVTLTIHDARLSSDPPVAEPGDALVHPDDVESLAMAAPFRRVITRLLDISNESV